MPTPSTSKLPIPKSADEFEDICCEALRLLWNDPHATRNGRSGQAQHGVDIYSAAHEQAAQCRNKASLSQAEVTQEVAAARGFRVPLKSLTFVISGPRDSNVQAMVEAVSLAEQQAGGFAVRVLFWDDLAQAIGGSPDLVRKHWGAFFAVPNMQPETLEAFRRREFGHLDDFGSYYDPDWWVARTYPDHGTLRAYDSLRLRIYSPNLQRADFEPEHEDSFAEAIGAVWRCPPPKVVPNNGVEVVLEQGGPEVGFHRRWGWSSRGCLGFVTTLRDLHRPTTFPVPDLVWDMEDAFGVAGAIAAEGECLFVFELDVFDLMPGWSPSDLRVSAQVGGLHTDAVPCPENRRTIKLVGKTNVAQLLSSPVVVAADVMVKALRDLFRARLNKEAFTQSLPGLRDQVRRAQVR